MTSTGQQSSKFRFDINALRAFAVILVVFYHFNIKGFSVGFIGVDIFFVISGFLMTQILLKMLENNRFNYWEFIFARVKRIWPALIVLVLTLASLGLVLLPPVDYYAFANQAKDALFFISNIEFSNGSGYFSSNIEERWFLHSWSLSVEWQFYCLYPLMLFAVWYFVGASKLASNKRSALNLVLFLLSIVSYVYSVTLTKTDQPHAFFSLNTRAWEMLVGAHVLLLTHTRLGAWVRSYGNFFKVISTLMFLSCVWLGHGGKWTLEWPGAFAMIPVAATGLYILSGVSNKWWELLENNAVVQSLGSWSYSIYLWHWPVVIAINFLWLSAIPFKLKLAGFATSIFLGFLSFKFVESAFREKKQSVRQILIKIFLMYFVAVVILLGMTSRQYSPIAKAAIGIEQQVSRNKLPKKFENHKLQPADNLNVYSINTQKNKKVVVIGDSHAEHLLPWFKRYASDYSVTFAVTNGCAPLPQMNRRDNTGWFCHRSFEKIQDLVEKNAFDLIVISGNWYPVDNEPPGVCYINFAVCNALNKNENQKIAVELFSDFINRNTEKNIPILIVRPTPFSNLSVSTVLPRYNLWGIEFPNTFIDRNFPSKSGDLFLDQVIRSISHPALIHVVDIRSEFCRNGICNYFDVEDTPVFWDDNHFNPAWLIKHGSVLFEVENILNKK